MLKYPPFSVLLSVYRKEQPAFLKQALDSIFAQTVRSNDVVLVEDGTLTDDLENVVKEYESRYPELHVVRYANNRGLGFALNDGLKVCLNDLVARADTDDICKPQRFERQLKILAENPDIDLVSAWIDEFIENPHSVTSQRRIPEWPNDIYQYGKRRCPVNHPVTIYKKSAVEAVGGYQTEFFPEDYYLWMKMLKAGCKFYNVQESLLWFRYDPDTFRRRGGWKYAKDEARTQWRAYHSLHYLSFYDFLVNIGIRFIVRIIPNSARNLIYKLIRHS